MKGKKPGGEDGRREGLGAQKVMGSTMFNLEGQQSGRRSWEAKKSGGPKSSWTTKFESRGATIWEAKLGGEKVWGPKKFSGYRF